MRDARAGTSGASVPIVTTNKTFTFTNEFRRSKTVILSCLDCHYANQGVIASPAKNQASNRKTHIPERSRFFESMENKEIQSRFSYCEGCDIPCYFVVVKISVVF